MKNIKLVSDIVWVKRGVPKKTPEKLKLESGELKRLMQGHVTKDNDISDEEMSDKEAEKSGINNNVVSTNHEVDNSLPISYSDNFYDMDKYDAESEKRSDYLSGITEFTSSLEDEYITTHVDSDEEEKEDVEIQPNDNLVVVAKVQDEEFTLEIYLYDETNNDWYVHHDYLLDAPPVCLETINYDPGADGDQKGNLLAVGTMDSLIGIWDLDVIGAASPIVSLGSKKGKKGQSSLKHEDSVLALSWNRLSKHVLASGGADNKIILWDVEEVKAAVAHPFPTRVQSLEWHIAEASLLLSGTLNGNIHLQDCRKDESVVKKWFVRGEVNKVLWDHFNPFCFFVADNEGNLSCFDSRMNEAIGCHKVHEGEVNGLSQSYFVKGLLSTCGCDNKLKIWKYSDNEFNLLINDNLQMETLHCVSFSPDSSTVIAVGGESSDLVRVINLTKYDNVTTAFSVA